MTAISLKKTHREYERALTAVFGLLIRGGVRHGAISRLSDRAFKSAIANAQTLGDSGSGELATLSLVLDAWHRDRRYLTGAGKPKAVPLRGPAPSVEALVRQEGPQCDATELVYRILSLRLIVPCSSGNRYRPTGDAALVSVCGPTILQYAARCVVSLLATVEDNLRGAASVPPLLERFAEVPDLPAECIESFRQFSRFQGAIFTRTINDWLQTRRARSSADDSRKHVRAGVHVHAYIAQAGAPIRLSKGAKRSSA